MFFSLTMIPHLLVVFGVSSYATSETKTESAAF